MVGGSSSLQFQLDTIVWGFSVVYLIVDVEVVDVFDVHSAFGTLVGAKIQSHHHRDDMEEAFINLHCVLYDLRTYNHLQIAPSRGVMLVQASHLDQLHESSARAATERRSHIAISRTMQEVILPSLDPFNCALSKG